jgi:coenzyme F420-reducing hydrogenase gamma subunit
VARHVKVDLELWGCPVNGRQVLAAVRALLFGVAPLEERDKVCLECKRSQVVCVLVAKGTACMGPVTRTGCGALCPRFGRDCYGCYGPAESGNADALARRFQGLGLLPEQAARRFQSINSGAPEFAEAALRLRR